MKLELHKWQVYDILDDIIAEQKLFDLLGAHRYKSFHTAYNLIQCTLHTINLMQFFIFSPGKFACIQILIDG